MRAWLALATVFLAAAAPGAAAGAQLTVRSTATVDGDTLTLADLVEVEGDPGLVARLASVRLGPAPPPGERRRVDPDWVRLRLSEQVPGARPRVPRDIVVERAWQPLDPGALVEAARRALEPTLDTAGARAVLVPVSIPGALRLPRGLVELAARPQARTTGPFVSTVVTVRIDGRDQQTVPLTFRVDRLRPVVVAQRSLEARRPLGGGDVRVEWRPAAEVPAGALASLDADDDLEVVRAIRAGEVVTEALVRPRTVVRRGEPVTLVVESPGLRVTALGTAQEDGRRGEPVRVVNPTSRREILGLVEGPGLVRVPFPGTTTARPGPEAR